MVILEVRRVCLNIHRYDWWANLCFHKRMEEWLKIQLHIYLTQKDIN